MEGQRSEEDTLRLKPEPGEIDVGLGVLLVGGYADGLHGRNDDPLEFASGVARVVHDGGVSAVLGIVLVAAVLGTAPYVVEVLAVRVEELDGRAVAVYVDYGPQGSPGLDAAEEDSLLLAIDAEVDVAGRRDVVEQDGVALRETFSQGLGPVARLVSQVGTGVPGQPAAEVYRVVAREPEAYDAAPVVGYLQELYAYLKLKKTIRVD